MPGSAQASQRQLRVGEEIRHALTGILAEGHVRDPAVAGRTITVTEVRISPDLRNATAFVMPLGGAELEPVVAALNRAAPYLRGQLAHAMRLRYAANIVFEPDRSFDEAARIEQLLHSEKVARDLEHPSRDEA